MIAPDASPALVCHEVWKSFGGIQALRGVTLSVQQGEILGLVGPNGSGKTTLINMISGHFSIDRGSIRLGEASVAGLAAHEIAGLGIARTYQIPRPFAHLTVLDNVVLAATFGKDRLDSRATRDEALYWLEFTGLVRHAADLPSQLNLHERKFLELARALAARPRLLLLDEVLSGLNPAEVQNAMRLIRDIRARGASIVFIEHLMRAVVELSDRVAVLNDGEAIAIGAPEEIMRDPEVVRAYLGKAYAS
jgi:branched-chain amino acid transport system permease protein